MKRITSIPSVRKQKNEFMQSLQTRIKLASRFFSSACLPHPTSTCMCVVSLLLLLQYFCCCNCRGRKRKPDNMCKSIQLLNTYIQKNEIIYTSRGSNINNKIKEASPFSFFISQQKTNKTS